MGHSPAPSVTRQAVVTLASLPVPESHPLHMQAPMAYSRRPYSGGTVFPDESTTIRMSGTAGGGGQMFGAFSNMGSGVQLTSETFCQMFKSSHLFWGRIPSLLSILIDG